MAQLTRTYLVDRARLEMLRRARDDLVLEVADGPDIWSCQHGPFASYRRELEVSGNLEVGSGRAVERIHYKLAAPVWWLLLTIPVRLALRRRDPTTLEARVGPPWWAPPDRLDAGQARTLSLLALCTLVTTYLGTLLSQSFTFVAKDFDASRNSQGALLAVVRLSVIATLLATSVADRVGRRRMLRLALPFACIAMATAAASTNLRTFGLSQIVGRGFTTGADLVILILAIEEVPARSRAYTASVLTLVGGLGSGMVVWLLPVVDLAPWAWRLLYGVPVVLLPLAWWSTRQLPESRRFMGRTRSGTASARPPWTRAIVGRLFLLGIGALLVAAFAAPASQFQNEYLRGERGFSAARISAFTLITSTPAGIGVFAGGRLSDVYGRRKVGAFGIVAGVSLLALSYQIGGWELWALATAGTILGAVTVPALRVYGPELFPTQMRGRANGILTLFAVSGSSSGVWLTGALAGRTGGFGTPFLLLAIGPMLVAVMVLTKYPETAGQTLEQLNPVDGPAPSAGLNEHSP